jgi:hypothetical protein
VRLERAQIVEGIDDHVAVAADAEADARTRRRSMRCSTALRSRRRRPRRNRRPREEGVVLACTDGPNEEHAKDAPERVVCIGTRAGQECVVHLGSRGRVPHTIHAVPERKFDLGVALYRSKRDVQRGTALLIEARAIVVRIGHMARAREIDQTLGAAK